MQHKFVSDTLTVCLNGHIDTSNSHEIEKQVFELLDQYSPSQVILDAQDLTYISSSGLRIILKLRQRFQNLKLINASSDVYEILDMTGFTEMMTIEKAYRVFDVTGCQVIGKGANGTVYRIDRDTIVKVYNKATDLDVIKQERELSRTAFVLGVPTAIPYDVVKVGDTYGSVFELLNAKSFDELMIEDASNLEFVVEKSVEVAKILHSTTAPESLPAQLDIARGWLSVLDGYLDDALYAKLKKLIEELPEKNTMIHGDLHIKNIMLQNDETLLIDMDTLCYGHPLYELAFIFNAYKGFGVVHKEKIENFLGFSIDIAHEIWRRTLETYLGTDDAARMKEVEDKASIIGYMRLMRRDIVKGLHTTEEGKAMLEACRKKLTELLPQYDTLDF